jgi:hypothetical protein
MDQYNINEGVGVKFDQDKPRMDLLPFDALIAAAEIFTFGAKKYSDNNWARGMRWGRLVASTLRHLSSFMLGEDNDKESGKSHISHALCCVLMLTALVVRGHGEDDRFVLEVPADEKC